MTEANILKAAMDVAARKGWAAMTMVDIAAEANVSMGELYRQARSKHGLLCCIADEANKAALSGQHSVVANGQSPRERLFELLMARLDALAPYKPGLKALAKDLPLDPGTGVLIAMVAPHSMAWMLEAAGIPLSGLAAPLKIMGLCVLHARLMRTWLADDSEDQGKTMAELDRLLIEAEKWGRRLGK